jgi:hypothetical protein
MPGVRVGATMAIVTMGRDETPEPCRVPFAHLQIGVLRRPVMLEAAHSVLSSSYNPQGPLP